MCISSENKIGESYVKSTKKNIYDNFCSVLGLTESKITANGEAIMEKVY